MTRGGERPRRGRLPELSVCLALSVAGAALGCSAQGFGKSWNEGVAVVAVEASEAADEAVDVAVLLSLAGVFYERIANRRFNSKATYDDPGLREYFRSVDSFSDYYASFAEALERANFESYRPTAVRLDRIERTAPNRFVIRVSFEGANALPLRWWSTHLVRDDHWEYSDDRWWIIPGKV